MVADDRGASISAIAEKVPLGNQIEWEIGTPCYDRQRSRFVWGYGAASMCVNATKMTRRRRITFIGTRLTLVSALDCLINNYVANIICSGDSEISGKLTPGELSDLPDFLNQWFFTFQKSTQIAFLQGNPPTKSDDWLDWLEGCLT